MSFLALPAETRILVYRHIFSCESLHLPFQPTGFTRVIRRRPFMRLLSILLVCLKCKDEARPIIFEEVTFQLGEDPALCGIDNDHPSEQIQELYQHAHHVGLKGFSPWITERFIQYTSSLFGNLKTVTISSKRNVSKGSIIQNGISRNVKYWLYDGLRFGFESLGSIEHCTLIPAMMAAYAPEAKDTQCQEWINKIHKQSLGGQRKSFKIGFEVDRH